MQMIIEEDEAPNARRVARLAREAMGPVEETAAQKIVSAFAVLVMAAVALIELVGIL